MLIDKLNNALEVGTITRNAKNDYTITVEHNSFADHWENYDIRVKLDIGYNLESELDVILNGRGWHTGVRVTPEIKEFMTRLQSREFRQSSSKIDAETKEYKEFWDTL